MNASLRLLRGRRPLMVVIATVIFSAGFTLGSSGAEKLKVVLPSNLIAVQGAQKASGSGFYAVRTGGVLAVDGGSSGLEILVQKGGTLNLVGSDAKVYLDAGAIANVTGNNNEIHMAVGSVVNDRGQANKKKFAAGFELVANTPPAPAPAVAPITPPSSPPVVVMPAKPAVPAPVPAPTAVPAPTPADKPTTASAAEALLGVLGAGNQFTDLLKLFPNGGPENLNVPKSIARSLREPLYGSWRIDSTSTEGFGRKVTPNITGKVWFAPGGVGWMDANIVIAGQPIARRGGFRWTATPEHITIAPDSGEESRWVRLQNTASAQQASFTTEAGVVIKMNLVAVE